MVSRVLGYVRDALVAHVFGGGHLTDAFYAAFRLSSLFRRVLGEGPLATAFVPVFAGHMARHDERRAREFFQSLFSVLAVLLLAVTALGIWAAPWIVRVAAGGFRHGDPDTFQTTIVLTRQVFPFLLFVCLAALSAAALNARGHFFLPALAPSMLSAATILYLLLFKRWAADPLQGLAISTTVGGLLHLLILLPSLRREGLWPRPRWAPRNPDVARVGLLVLPAICGLSLDQVNAYVDTVCASYLVEGSVTALYNSNRLMQFALAIFGMSISTASLPHLAACAAKNDDDGFRKSLDESLRLTLYLVLPSLAGLVVLARPIVRVLFEHGRFTPDKTALTVAALVAYALGLPAFSLVKVLVTSFYARQDTRTPVWVASAAMAVNIAGNILLMRRWGVGGLAFATSMASTVQAGVLFILLRRRLAGMDGARLGRTLGQAAAASLATGVAAWGIHLLAPGPMVVRLFAGVAGGAGVYLSLTWWWGMEEFFLVRSIVKGAR